MLGDLDDILSRPQNQDVEASDFKAAASRMLRQQTLYRDEWNSKAHYDHILRFRRYFGDLFDALGLDLVISERDLTISLKPQQSQGHRRLSLDETVILLLLRSVFEQGVISFDIGDHGEVGITTMEMLERYEAITGRPRPAWPRVREILREFKRRHVIAFGQEFPDESGMELIVRPSIREITGEGYLARIEEYLAARDRLEVAAEQQDLPAEQDGGAGSEALVPSPLPESDAAEFGDFS